jgi:hypothetical protein
MQHEMPGPSWRQSKPMNAHALRTKIRETQVLGCSLSVGLNTTNMGSLVGLVNPRDVDSYRPVVRVVLSDLWIVSCGFLGVVLRGTGGATAAVASHGEGHLEGHGDGLASWGL